MHDGSAMRLPTLRPRRSLAPGRPSTRPTLPTSTGLATGGLDLLVALRSRLLPALPLPALPLPALPLIGRAASVASHPFSLHLGAWAVVCGTHAYACECGRRGQARCRRSPPRCTTSSPSRAPRPSFTSVVIYLLLLYLGRVATAAAHVWCLAFVLSPLFFLYGGAWGVLGDGVYGVACR